MKHFLKLSLITWIAGSAFGAGVTICSSGFATATVSGCGPILQSPASNNLVADGNWYVAKDSSGTFQSNAFVTVNNSYPLGVNPGPWLANDSNSAWVTPSNNQGATYANGQFYFASQFQVAPGQQNNVQLAGTWLADDYGSGVYLNGVATSQSAMPVFGGLGGPMIAFSISTGSASLGQAVFNGGTNILTFGVTNDSTNHGASQGGPTPTGFRVNITNAQAGVPEPSTILLLSAGFAGMGILARRRKSA